MTATFIKLHPNQMLVVKALISIGQANSYQLYQRIKAENALLKIASSTMIYPILESLGKKELIKVAGQTRRRTQQNSKFTVTALGIRVFTENQKAYSQLAADPASTRA